MIVDYKSSSVYSYLLIIFLINNFLTHYVLSSFRGLINFWSSQRNSSDIIQIILCRSMWRSDAWNFDNDPNIQVDANSCSFGYGFALHALFDCLWYFCIDQLCWLCYLGKKKKILLVIVLNLAFISEIVFYFVVLKISNLLLFQLSIGVAVLCLPWLRYAQPNLPRPIRVPLIFPVVYLVASLFVTIVPMIASPVETGYGCLMILTAVPVYLIFIAWKNKPYFFQKGMCK